MVCPRTVHNCPRKRQRRALARGSLAAGNEAATVGMITVYFLGNLRMEADDTFAYWACEDGLVRSIRAFWEIQWAVSTIKMADN